MISLRRATLDDVEWLVELLGGAETEPFLGGQAARDRASVRAQVERSQREPDQAGTMIIEVGGERAGTMKFELVSHVHRIARIGGLAVHPAFRARLLRLQRPRNQALGACGVRARGSEAARVSAPRRVAGRRSVLPPAGRPGVVIELYETVDSPA
jgi:hypothetical protein